MAKKRTKRPRDPVQLAKLIGDIATGQLTDIHEDDRNPAAIALGRAGGLKGGKITSAKMSKAERKARAKKGADARWSKLPQP